MTDQTACRPGTIATIALPAGTDVGSAIVAGIVRTRPGVRAVQHQDHMDVCAPETEQRTTLTIPGDPKMIREALCVAENATLRNVDEQNRHGAREVLGALIQECDRHRPLGPDGKHGQRHTATCGCDDVPERHQVAAMHGPDLWHRSDPAAETAARLGDGDRLSQGRPAGLPGLGSSHT